ncbi:metallophosphoesterase family protein [Thermincola potens]|uniref:Nuclease SbcCD subunit D n=1 Tax=Thermincola potens (strain JR) TaxID=635013 RepID=D5XE01_THEPJ|nr:exonuclease SbcCD subunit D [Thermincola potens]ADG81872.1 metallophosphoesterase [Thermincola potens JR]
MAKVSFIHASDIHLGHRQFNLEQRFRDFGLAFKQVVDTALARKVDFVLIGGDFFHKRAIDAETLRQAMELLTPLKEAGIPVVAIEGNHDKAFYQEKSSWLNLLNALGYIKLLKPVYREGKVALAEWDREEGGCILEEQGMRIIGLGYLGATTAQRLEEIASELTFWAGDKGEKPFTVLLLHAAVDRLLGQDLGGVKKEILDSYRGQVDYIALGHIHARQEIDDWVYNPGSLENCHIDEAKEGREKGFYYVTVNGLEKKVEYIPASPRRVCILPIDITGSANPAEVREKIWQELRKAEVEKLDEPILQIVLKGEIEFSSLAIDVAALTKEIREGTQSLYVEVQNHANLPAENMEGKDRSMMTRAEIERQVLKQLVGRQHPAYRHFADELVSLVIKVKEASLNGEPARELIAEIEKLACELPEEDLSADMVAAAGGIPAVEGGEGVEDSENQAAEH